MFRVHPIQLRRAWFERQLYSTSLFIHYFSDLSDHRHQSSLPGKPIAMTSNGRTETNCSKCGQLLFADVKRENGSSEQVYPPLPCLVRIVDPPSNNQIICPSCGYVNKYSSPLADHVLRVV